eukprot:6199809-Alexandrium_andersonii.AAC.1
MRMLSRDAPFLDVIGPRVAWNPTKRNGARAPGTDTAAPGGPEIAIWAIDPISLRPGPAHLGQS